ncbi:hypothetical protein HMPREF3293_01716 [Christensenella minuta]|uniref:Uncharacterized protein n=1 Tax=Christensenella minuta TaxID=626937 RepID=A0A136Q4C2_9FIRM|nr:hypothetical protein HMPREF3293_01716 [Christensenella minuta]
MHALHLTALNLIPRSFQIRSPSQGQGAIAPRGVLALRPKRRGGTRGGRL